MLRRFWLWLTGTRCRKHNVAFRSDFCPQCVRAMVVRYETRHI